MPRKGPGLLGAYEERGVGGRDKKKKKRKRESSRDCDYSALLHSGNRKIQFLEKYSQRGEGDSPSEHSLLPIPCFSTHPASS